MRTQDSTRVTETTDSMEIDAARRPAKVVRHRSASRLGVAALLVLGLPIAAAPVAFAQEHDHEHDHAAHVQPTDAGPGDPELEAAIYEELAQPVVDAYREEFKTAANPDTLRTPLRALIGRIHDTVAARLVDQEKERR